MLTRPCRGRESAEFSFFLHSNAIDRSLSLCDDGRRTGRWARVEKQGKNALFRRLPAALSPRRRRGRLRAIPEHAPEARRGATRESNNAKKLGGGLTLDRVFSLSAFLSAAPSNSRSPPLSQPPATARPTARNSPLSTPGARPTIKGDSHVGLLLVCSRGVRKGEGGKRRLKK